MRRGTGFGASPFCYEVKSLLVRVRLLFGSLIGQLAHKGGELGNFRLELGDAASVFGDTRAVASRCLLAGVGHELAVTLGVEGFFKDAASVALDDASRHAHHGAVGRNVLDDNGVAADFDVIADGDVSQHLGAAANGHVIAQRGVALACFVAGAAQGDALVERTVIANDRGLANNDAHGMVDEEVLADVCGGVNLDAGHMAGYLRHDAREAFATMVPQPVLGHMIPFSVKAGVGKKDDEAVLRGRVFPLDVGDILANCRDKAHLRHPFRANDALKYSELLGLMSSRREERIIRFAKFDWFDRKAIYCIFTVNMILR